jgi:hypothetical protein
MSSSSLCGWMARQLSAKPGRLLLKLETTTRENTATEYIGKLIESIISLKITRGRQVSEYLPH